jgi:hypothetical protein
MPYQRIDLVLDENADWSPSPAWSYTNAGGIAIDLTNYTATMMVRRAIADAAPILTLTAPGGGVVLGGALGTVTPTITRAQVNALVASMLPNRLIAYYDLALISWQGSRVRFSEGQLAIDRAATR